MWRCSRVLYYRGTPHFVLFLLQILKLFEDGLATFRFWFLTVYVLTVSCFHHFRLITSLECFKTVTNFYCHSRRHLPTSSAPFRQTSVDSSCRHYNEPPFVLHQIKLPHVGRYVGAASIAGDFVISHVGLTADVGLIHAHAIISSFAYGAQGFSGPENFPSVASCTPDTSSGR